MERSHAHDAAFLKDPSFRNFSSRCDRSNLNVILTRGKVIDDFEKICDGFVFSFGIFNYRLTR